MNPDMTNGSPSGKPTSNTAKARDFTNRWAGNAMPSGNKGKNPDMTRGDPTPPRSLAVRAVKTIGTMGGQFSPMPGGPVGRDLNIGSLTRGIAGIPKK